jgi:hypothetical protein
MREAWARIPEAEIVKLFMLGMDQNSVDEWIALAVLAFHHGRPWGSHLAQADLKGESMGAMETYGRILSKIEEHLRPTADDALAPEASESGRRIAP